MALSTTPRRPSASRVAPDRIPLRERAQIPRRRLFYPDGDSTKTPGAAGAWLGDEVKALVEFLLFHKKGDTWPCHKREAFWTGAASFVQIRAKTSHKRTSKQFYGFLMSHLTLFTHYRQCMSL